jgi:hypothetical protein
VSAAFKGNLSACHSFVSPGLGSQPFHKLVHFSARVFRVCHFRYSVRNSCQLSVTTFRHERTACHKLVTCSELSIVQAARGTPVVNSKVSPALARGHFSLYDSLHIISHYLLLLLIVQRAWWRFQFALWELACVSSLVPSKASSRSGSLAPVLLYVR